ncbi:MAG: hypothetical protein Fur0022_19450 [Anaerolineales bacterium]
MSWKTQFTAELQRGQQARVDGNEGMARVCARRAAGEVVREYYRRQQVSLPKPSALYALKTLSQSEQVSPCVREIATHFIWQITLEHTLPGDVDLIAEVQWLAKELLGDG